MVSDEERRKAAEWLRSEIGNGHHWPGALTIAEAIGVPDPTGSGWEGRLLGRLADLMEPGDMSQGRRDIVACDRDALLALVDEMETADPEDLNVAIDYVTECASRIREALGVEE